MLKDTLWSAQARGEVQDADRAAAALKLRLGHLEEAARNPGGRTPEQVRRGYGLGVAF